MKLLAKYNRVTLISTIIVLFFSAIVYYLAISYILTNEVDNDIAIEEQEILSYVKENGSLPPPEDNKLQQIRFSPTTGNIKRRFHNIHFYNEIEREHQSGRVLLTSVVVKGRYYKVSIIESKVETEDLIQIIFFITLAITLFFFLVLFIGNRFVLNRMWRPFYAILIQLRAFSLADERDIVSTESTIDEFAELNKAVIGMSAKVKRDYKDLKTFTENASHELLTPIAVINSKLDSLIQNGEYNETQSKLLGDVYSAMARLARLNQSLLLLVKIENRLLNDEQLVDLRLFIEDKLSEFKELFINKQLKLEPSLANKQINISRYLIDVLLNNLLSNAIRHNIPNGIVKIILTNDSLVVQNTGVLAPLLTYEVFSRFKKSANSEGSGLGLTISKQICDNYAFNLNYTYVAALHTFTIVF